MKRALLIGLMTATTLTFMGCSKVGNLTPSKDTVVMIEDDSVEDNLDHPDNSEIKEFNEIADGNFDVDIEGTSNDSPDKPSKLNNMKTIKLDGASVEIPIDWEELKLEDDVFYMFNNSKCTANFLAEDMQGLTPEKYMELAEKSVKVYLDIDTVRTETKTVNGVKIISFEYIQVSEDMTVYTYQPTIFKNGKAYILTLGAADKNVFKENKDLVCEIVSSIK